MTLTVAAEVQEECVAILFACFDHGFVDLVASHEKPREVEHVDAWVRVGGTNSHSRKLLLLSMRKETMEYVQCPSAIPQGDTQHQLKTHLQAHSLLLNRKHPLPYLLVVTRDRST